MSEWLWFWMLATSTVAGKFQPFGARLPGQLQRPNMIFRLWDLSCLEGQKSIPEHASWTSATWVWTHQPVTIPCLSDWSLHFANQCPVHFTQAKVLRWIETIRKHRMTFKKVLFKSQWFTTAKQKSSNASVTFGDLSWHVFQQKEASVTMQAHPVVWHNALETGNSAMRIVSALTNVLISVIHL